MYFLYMFVFTLEQRMNEDFRTNLKEIRLFLGMSQGDLAKRTGLTPSAISHFETGQREPLVGNLIKLADALSVTVDRLLKARGNDE